MSGPPTNMLAIRQRAAAQFPALETYIRDAAMQWGDPANNPAGGHLEFFPPWEKYNPNPGQVTLEFYDPRMQGNALATAIGGDMLHHIGSVDPRSGQAVDPQWLAMKRALVGSLTPEQLQVDRTAYDRDRQRGEQRPFDDWMQDSRADAYIRGKLTPDAANNWRDVYTPQQNALLSGMAAYLQKPPVSPENMPPSNALTQVLTRGIWGDR